VAVIASTCVSSISSIASYSSFAQNPMDRIAIAMTPANTPGPMIAISRSAQISELMERVETIISNAMGRIRKREGVVLRAAKKATGTARTIRPSPRSARTWRTATFTPCRKTWMRIGGAKVASGGGGI